MGGEELHEVGGGGTPARGVVHGHWGGGHLGRRGGYDGEDLRVVELCGIHRGGRRSLLVAA